MTTLLHFPKHRATLAVLAVAAIATGFSLHAKASHAASPWTVTITPAAVTYPAGTDATFIVHVDGTGTQLPSFEYTAEGGTIDSAPQLQAVSTTAAEARVQVRRNSGGTASLSAEFGGQTLATGNATFAALGAITINVTLQADDTAAARTWRFEVIDPTGKAVSTLNASTSGDALTGTATTPLLPYATYTVRQVLGNDTATACSAQGAFYAVTSPAGASTAVSLSSAAASAEFEITPCNPPVQYVSIPVDPIAFPTPAPTPTFTTAPGQTPVNEVRGVRQEGPGDAGVAATSTVLPPNTGSGVASQAGAGAGLFELLGLALAAAAPLGAAYGLHRRAVRQDGR